MNITNHAYDRAKNRLGWKKSTLDRMADVAFNEGVTHGKLKNKFRKYMDGIWFTHKNCNNPRVYGEHIFFFSGETLVTIYRVPNKYLKYLK